jgi:hypothetical protein
MPLITLALAFLLAASVAWAQAPQRQTQQDDYTRYELLAPETQSFRILYEVTATTPGARFYFNTIRPGSEASDEQVWDLATGAALKWEVVGGVQAQKEGHPAADATTEYIKVYLARPVPQGGQARIRIDKTYKDPKSYRRDGDAIVFDRSLGIRRNSIVLPAGYRLERLNVPSQLNAEPDGRVRVAFMNPGPAAAPLVIRAVPGLPAFTPRPLPATRGPSAGMPLASQATRLDERAHQDREIVYFLNDPATHSFSLYHDYTESRPGMDRYLNIVRGGSTVSNASAISLDTGETLEHETLKGAAIAARGIDIGGAPAADTEVVVVRFPPVKEGASARLRITETYTDPGRYYMDGDELVWDRAFGRPRNTVVLPAGWTAIASSIPATVSPHGDGRQQLYFENARNDEIQVLIRARRAENAR